MFLAGCGTYSTDRGDANEDYRTGTQGLVINFMTNMPQSKVYDDDVISTVIEARNRGAYDILTGSNSKIYLSGFDPNYILNTDGMGSGGKDIGTLEGKSQYNAQGDFDTYSYEGTPIDLANRDIDNYDFKLVATACYLYKTIAEPTVCIDYDVFTASSKEKACDAERDPSLGSQGAPIRVDSIEVEPSKGRTRFKMTISNAGSGTVFKNDYSMLDRCNPYDATGLEYNDIDYIRLSKVIVSNVDITGTCKPVKDGYLRLNSGRATVVCEFNNIAPNPAYTTTLFVELDYGYRETISKDIQVIATP